MERFKGKTAELGSKMRELEMNLHRARKGNPPCSIYPEGKSSMRNQSLERLEKKIADTKLKIVKMKVNMKIREDIN